MKEKNSREDGMVIIEASIVFPIMFIVIFILIYAGNAYMQKCKVESIVSQAAIQGAAYCADPMLDYVEANEKVPSLGDMDVKPYRFMLGGMEDITVKIQKDINEKLNNLNSGFFSNMKPICETPKVEFNNHFIYSTFSVELTYKIPLPIRMLASNDALYIKVASRYDAPVSDVPEFIRNVNMIEDYMETYGIVDKIQELVDKAKKVMGKK